MWNVVVIAFQFRSVAQSCPTLGDPLNRRRPGLLRITSSRSLLELVSIDWLMPSNRLIVCRPPSPALKLSQDRVAQAREPSVPS